MRISFDLKKLSHVMAVAKAGSFSLAANDLGLTQPSLSRNILALEQEWQVRIFERGRHGAKLTADGAALLREIEHLFSEVNTLDHNMRLRAAGQIGSLSFGMAPLAGAIFLSEILEFTVRTIPALNVMSVIEPLDQLLEAIRSDRLDFAVFSETDPPSCDKITLRSLGQIPLGFIVRSGHPLAVNGRAVWDEIADCPLAASPHIRDSALPRAPNITCNSHAALKQAMLASDLICYSSPWLVRTELAAGTLSLLQIPPRHHPKPALLYLARLERRMASSATNLVVDEILRLISATRAIDGVQAQGAASSRHDARH